MKVTCFNCNNTTTLEVLFEVESFACPHCVYTYKNARGEGLKYFNKSKPYYYEYQFKVGSKANFDGIEYQVTGLLIKSSNGYEWTEYILESKKGEYLYLSESNGHWILLNQIDFDKKVGNHPKTVEYQDIIYDRYNYCYPTLVAAQGFFDFDIYSKFEIIEYINPPLMLSFEKLGKEQTCFYGKHISRSAIKKAFNTTDIDKKTGIGQVQPFLFNIRNLGLICASVAMIILLSHWYMNLGRTEQNVLNTEIIFDQYINRDYTTPAFTLQGSSAPMSIRVHADVDNSWANVQLALINEITGEETYANKDIEYYHGYTDGENWTEGTATNEFNICGVAAGKYHLAITPMKAYFDSKNQKLQITATWAKPSYRNVYMTFIFMIVFVIGMYYLNQNFENKRWEE
ncbi:hypothetical protein FFWV33_04580 [Flavobacterium faecale]|uniref:DUF4178 domain-containing protein n=1 Tax=Flavobacterium faecale TaxID=1355330 RepID=A0A2S1LAT7_9FLAO|nr:DUF4178 domain-containing protein [Flavobacterium faecale]AWG20870.1 hypothetical protein FFWV33_04580 [Flavobacterium faecale]